MVFYYGHFLGYIRKWMMAATFLVNYKNNLCPSRKLFVISKKGEKLFIISIHIWMNLLCIYMEKIYVINIRRENEQTKKKKS